VRVRVFTAEMDSIGNLAPQTIRSHGYLDLAAATGNWYQTIIAPNIGRTLRLPAINGFPGQSGFYIGVRLEGPNYANTANGWQRCQAPTTGTAFNTFAVSTPTVLQAGYYYFTPDGTPSYFSCSATGKFNYDSDGDTWIDGCDNCPSVYNPGQEDGDGNSIGDACDTPTGTGNLVLGPSFAIHPNPAAGDAVVWASLPGLRTLRFIDAAGRVAAELPFAREMGVEQLAPGVYVVMGLDEAGRELARTRFVRQ
jgi:hypothetical protein